MNLATVLKLGRSNLWGDWGEVGSAPKTNITFYHPLFSANDQEELVVSLT